MALAIKFSSLEEALFLDRRNMNSYCNGGSSKDKKSAMVSVKISRDSTGLPPALNYVTSSITLRISDYRKSRKEALEAHS